MADMQHYSLTLFHKDDSRFELRILNAQQKVLFTSPLIDQSDIDTLLELAKTQYRPAAADLIQQGQTLFKWIDQHCNGWLPVFARHRSPWR